MDPITQFQQVAKSYVISPTSLGSRDREFKASFRQHVIVSINISEGYF